jgi:hypothetical protein
MVVHRAIFRAVVKQIDCAGKGIREVEAGLIAREGHAVRAANSGEHTMQRAIQFQPVKASLFCVARHGAAEYPSPRIGDDIIESRVPLLLDPREYTCESAFAPIGDTAAVHKEEKRSVTLYRESAYSPARVPLLVGSRGQVKTKDAALRVSAID